MQVTLEVDLLPALPLPPNQPCQDGDIGTEEGKALQPDEQERVVSLELQQIGGQKPRSLILCDNSEKLEKYKLKPVQSPTRGLQEVAA